MQGTFRPFGHLKPKFKMTEIMPNLWLGNLDTTYDMEFLQEAKITHVLSIIEIDHSTPAMVAKGVIHMRIRMYDRDEEPIYSVFPTACKFMEDALKGGGAVYVHCLMGMSRSPTLVAAYLIKTHGMSAEEALTFLVARRPIVSPNDGFRASLVQWGARAT